MKREITLEINGREETITVEDADTLLEVLRDRFKLWSVRESCGVGACGTCTVLLDGRPVSSCFVLAVRAAGRHITTLEGLSDGQSLHRHSRSLCEPACLAMRLLHARVCPLRESASRRDPKSVGRRDSRIPLRQPLPLCWLRGYPTRRSAGSGAASKRRNSAAAEIAANLFPLTAEDFSV